MKESKQPNLEVSTWNLLAAIEAAEELHGNYKMRESDHVMARIRLRDAFEAYLEVALAVEERFGTEATLRSRYVIETVIENYKEVADNATISSLPITEDINVFSKLLAETFIQETARVQ